MKTRLVLLGLLAVWIAALVLAAWVLAALLQPAAKAGAPPVAAATRPAQNVPSIPLRSQSFLYLPALMSAPANAAPQEPQPKPDPFSNIEFGNGDLPISIAVDPPDDGANRGEAFELRFATGNPCRYEDKRACLDRFITPAGGSVRFITIHSGMYAEGQPFRHAVEGTALYAAAYNLERIAANLDSLSGAPATISQGDARLDTLELALVVRVPPGGLERYFRAAPQDGLRIAAEYDPHLLPLLEGGDPLVIFETCGWRVPGEPNAPAATDTSASIYLAVIRAKAMVSP